MLFLLSRGGRGNGNTHLHHQQHQERGSGCAVRGGECVFGDRVGEHVRAGRGHNQRGQGRDGRGGEGGVGGRVREQGLAEPEGVLPYESLGLKALQECCTSRNIAHSGNKSALIQRLQDKDAGKSVPRARRARQPRNVNNDADIMDDDSCCDALDSSTRKRDRSVSGDDCQAQGTSASPPVVPASQLPDNHSADERVASQDMNPSNGRGRLGGGGRTDQDQCDCSGGVGGVSAGEGVMLLDTWEDRLEVLRNFPSGNLDRPDSPLAFSLDIPLGPNQSHEIERGVKASRLELDLTTIVLSPSLRFNNRDYGSFYDQFLTTDNVDPVTLLSTGCVKQGHRCLLIAAGMGAGVHPFVLESFLQNHGRFIASMLQDSRRVAGPLDDSVQEIVQHLLRFNDHPDIAIFSFIYPLEFNSFRFLCAYFVHIKFLSFLHALKLFPVAIFFALLLPPSRQTGAGSLRLSYFLAASTVARFRCARQRCFHSSSQQPLQLSGVGVGWRLSGEALGVGGGGANGRWNYYSSL